MKLSEETKQELLKMAKSDDFKKIRKQKVFADTPGTKEGIREFTDFIQMFHEMAGHPQRKPRIIKGDFKLWLRA